VDDGAVVGRAALAAEVPGVSLKEPGAGKHSSGRIEGYQIVGLQHGVVELPLRRARNDAGVYGCCSRG